MTKVILSGCNGNMGNVISRLCENDDDIKIVCGVDINTAKNWDYPVVDSISNAPADADVIVDFSHPSCLSGVLEFAVKNKVSAVICTTGLSDKQKSDIVLASKEAPIFFSANMSIGINLMIELAKKAAKLLEDNFDIEIIEKHHNQKIDAPSGTALAIADAVSDTLSEKPEYIYDRHSMRRKRSKNEIGIHSLRGGSIVGEHELIFAGCDEVISIKHQATSKEVFAVGAIRAAKYMCKKSAGLYSMSNLVSEIS